MSIKYPLILMAAMLIAQPVFANEDMGPGGRSCGVIAKTCLNAGYTRDGAEGKHFWEDCMQPVIINQTVTGVTVDAKDAKACRMAKINELQHELSELKAVK